MKILLVCGSLRANSSNKTLLQAVIALAPAGIQVELYNGLGELPHFNPDADNESVSPSVGQWRQSLSEADGVIFSTPEYAHGIPGVLKNALDWVVGSGELAGKPVTLFNASARGTYAQASLSETLTIMSATVVREAPITLPLLGAAVSVDQIVADATMSGVVRTGLKLFIEHIRSA